MAKKPAPATHESFSVHHDAKGSSDRSFGLVFTAFFALVGLAPLRHHLPVRLWALLVAAAFLATALILPALLAPLNRQWTRLSFLLQKITSPVVIGVLFYVVLTPAGLLMRLFGKDPLRLRFEPDTESYWIKHERRGPDAEAMRHQF